MDSGEYYCEARNSVGSRRCPGKRMQVGKHELLRSTAVWVECGEHGLLKSTGVWVEWRILDG